MISLEKEKVTRNFALNVFVAESQTTATPLFGDDGQEYFGAGQFVLAGCYAEVDGFRQVYLDAPGILPASLDGRRALYHKLERPWIKLAQNQAVGEDRADNYHL